MRLNKYLIALTTVTALASPPLAAEIKTFIGIDVVEIETELKPSNIVLKYQLTGIRLRYGIENDAGGSAGMEIISGDSDTDLDQFGNPLTLETGETFGLYATLGKPVYLRVGWSIWQTELTDPAFGLITKETVNSLEIGLGVNLLLGRNLTLYADWAVRNTDAVYPGSFIPTGEIDYESQFLSAGFNLKF
jgi:hypothetical protein